MIIFKNSKFKVIKQEIPVCYETTKTQFFVDTLCGKNKRVFDSQDEAITWANRR